MATERNGSGVCFFLLFQLCLLHACSTILHIATHSFAFRNMKAMILTLFNMDISLNRKREKSSGEKSEELLFYL